MLRRIARNVLAFLSILSLLLFLSVCVLWVRSYQWVDRIFCRAEDVRWIEAQRGDLSIQSEPGINSNIPVGSLRLDHQPISAWQATPALYELRYVSFPIAPDTIVQRQWLGIEIYTLENANRMRVTEVVLPFWSLAIAAAALPLGLMSRKFMQHARKRRRRSEGLCTSCGYDVRASPQCCPECGASVAHA